jgi:hypothetical protein
MPLPKLWPLRAHFLKGTFSEEKLASLSGQEVDTLSPTTHWEIRNISGVRGELWEEEGMGGSVGCCRFPQTRASGVDRGPQP